MTDSSAGGPGAAILTAVQERAAQAAEAAAKAKPKFTVKVKRKATEDAEGEAAAKKTLGRCLELSMKRISKGVQ